MFYEVERRDAKSTILSLITPDHEGKHVLTVKKEDLSVELEVFRHSVNVSSGSFDFTAKIIHQNELDLYAFLKNRRGGRSPVLPRFRDLLRVSVNYLSHYNEIACILGNWAPPQGSPWERPSDNYIAFHRGLKKTGNIELAALSTPTGKSCRDIGFTRAPDIQIDPTSGEIFVSFTR